MVAHPASQPGGYTPFEQPRVSVAGDGTLAAIHETSRVTILELPSATPFAEIGVDPDALASEVGWIGAPSRLLVLSRYDAHSTVHLLDPYGPRTIAEIRLEASMRLFATVGTAALVVGSLGAAVLAATESHLTPYQFPARNVPVAAGAAAGQFVVALSGSIEEWDPQSRMPKRRLRLPRAAAITAVGGSERLVWMTTQQEPARIDVIPLVNRGQPKAHDLPEPIARIASHPRSDLVACVGADSGRLYVVDLDGRKPLRVIGPEGIDRIESIGLVIGRMIAVVAAQEGRPLAIVPLDGRELDGDPAGAAFSGVLPRSEPAKRSTLLDEDPERPQRDARDDRRGAEPADASEARPQELPGAHSPEPAGAHSPEPAGARSPEPLPEDTAPPPPLTAAPPPPLTAAPPPPLTRAPPPPLTRAPPPPLTAAPPPPLTAAPPPALTAAPPPALTAAPPPVLTAAPAPPPATAAPAPPPPTMAPPPTTAKLAAPTPVTSLFRHPTPQPATARAAAPPAARPAPSASERFSAWRDLVRQNQPRGPIGSAPPAGPPVARGDARQSWRDEIVAWSRAVTAGAMEHNAPAAPAIDALLARFELALQLQPVLALLYGAHLCGERGAAPIDVARVLDRQWDEALGRGELAQRGVAGYLGSRVALSPVILRVLDELPPVNGTLVGEPGSVSLLGPCLVVAGDEPITAIAERCLSRVGGAILAASGEPDRAELLFEARAYGAAPMLRPAVSLDAAPPEPAIFVVADVELADRLGLPRLA